MFRSKRKTANRRNFAGAAYTQTYPTRVSFYTSPPLEEITLEQFESWAIDRLKVLVELQSLTLRQKSAKEMESLMKPSLQKYLPLSPPSQKGEISDHEMTERRKDHYSHFILSLVFCRSEDLRAKFVRNETALFKLRYAAMSPSEQRAFVNHYSERLPWDFISPEEKQQMFDQLYRSSFGAVKAHLLAESHADSITEDQVRTHMAQNEQFIRVPFERVPQLVGSRQVYVHKGYAYLPSMMQTHMIAAEFSDALTAKLIKTAQSLPRLEEDDRLLPMMQHLAENFSTNDGYTANESASDINAASVLTPAINQHFPLCAKRQLDGLVATSHLMHEARLQFGLFLKGIGLGVEEALAFWRQQFTKGGKITSEDFRKNYAYNVNHSYGLNGSRINYQPPPCAKIFARPRPGRDQFHGCPYRDLNRTSLESSLRDMGLSDTDSRGVADMVDGPHKNGADYTAACTRVFELTHPGADVDHMDHPNLYFDRSRAYAKKNPQEIK
ncbi:DNA primase large subunit [Diutina catenulata]